VRWNFNCSELVSDKKVSFSIRSLNAGTLCPQSTRLGDTATNLASFLEYVSLDPRAEDQMISVIAPQALRFWLGA
jgi:hypothetical protein